MINFKNLKINLYISLLFLIPFIICLIWFHGGRIIASGEGGIPFYDSARIGNLYRFSWYETGTGAPGRIFLPFALPFIVFGFVQNMGVPGFILQAVEIYILMLVGMLSMYFIVLETIPVRENKTIAFISGLFYLLNVFSMSQVWGRLLYTQYFAFALLPLLFLIFIKSYKYKSFIFFIPLAILLFPTAFGLPTFFVDVLFLCAAFSFYKYITEKRKKTIILHFLLWISVFLLLNIWWIVPTIQLKNSAFSTEENVLQNLGSAQGVSEFFPVFSVLRLIHNLLVLSNPNYYSSYKSPFFIFLSWLIPLICFFAISKIGRIKAIYYFLAVAVIGIFISSGTNPPLGFIFSWLFLHMPFFELFRNPFEKFGLVLLFAYAVLFGIGLTAIVNILKRRVSKLYVSVFIITSLICINGIFVWPIWTGKVMSNKYVAVPAYYKDANDWLNKENNDFRILQVPLSPGDGIAYTWGYDGAEPSEFLFDKPSVSKILRTKYFDDAYIKLIKDFNNNSDYLKDFATMHIGYIVLHGDLSKKLSWNNYKDAKKIIEANPRIKFIKKFGELSVYQYIGNTDPGLFIAKGRDKPQISYKKQSPTHYKVFVKNAKKPFDLIFRETFNKFWVARIDSRKVNDHFLVYNYANGWKVDKKGNYRIDVVFKVWPWE